VGARRIARHSSNELCFAVIRRLFDSGQMIGRAPRALTATGSAAGDHACGRWVWRCQMQRRFWRGFLPLAWFEIVQYRAIYEAIFSERLVTSPCQSNVFTQPLPLAAIRLHQKRTLKLHASSPDRALLQAARGTRERRSQKATSLPRFLASGTKWISMVEWTISSWTARRLRMTSGVSVASCVTTVSAQE
jgi:hypothetical protein